MKMTSEDGTYGSKQTQMWSEAAEKQGRRNNVPVYGLEVQPTKQQGTEGAGVHRHSHGRTQQR
jgi:hypothetical protein